jgi:glutaredoxin-like YruB-family protein
MSEIIIYTTPTCRYCVLAKEYFRTKGMHFEEIDVREDKTAAKALIRRTGEYEVPQIEINGNMIIGFDKEAIDRELRR